jgi:hypothetical protein
MTIDLTAAHNLSIGDRIGIGDLNGASEWYVVTAINGTTVRLRRVRRRRAA